MRIALIGARSVPAHHGGVERAVESLAHEYVARGHEVTVFVSESDGRGPDGVQVRRVRTVRGKYVQAPIQALSSALRTGRGFDVAHVHGIGPGVAVPLLRARGIPVVLTVHALDFERDKWPPLARKAFRALSRPGVRRADRVVVVAKHLRHDVEREYGVSSVVVPNGVTTECRVGATERLTALGLEPRAYLLFVGRLVPEKRVEVLLQAHARLGRTLPLVVVGGGEGSFAGGYDEQLRAEAGEGVRFLGELPHETVCELVRGAAMLVNPSSLEGMPLTVLEARALGTPVVLSDIAPHRELSSRSSLFFAEGDVAELTDVLQDAIGRREELADKARLEARRVVSTYAWGSVAERTLAVYAEALQARDRRRTRRPAEDRSWSLSRDVKPG